VLPLATMCGFIKASVKAERARRKNPSMFDTCIERHQQLSNGGVFADSKYSII